MNFVGIEQVVKAGGQTFRLSRFTRKLLRLWFEWADTVIPRPLDIAEQYIDDFPDPVALIYAATELEELKYSFFDSAFSQLWESDEGKRKALSLLFLKYHPDKDIHDTILDEIPDAAKILMQATGHPPVDSWEQDSRYFQELGFAIESEEPEQKPLDWIEFDKSIFMNCGLTPEQLDEMTPTEILVLARKEKERSIGDAAKIARIQRLLTPRQQLELARLKHR